MEELLRYNFKQRYIVFDTETEGLNLITSKPWQVAWIECEGKKVVKKHNRFIKWDNLNVSPEAARVTGFDRDHYESVAEDPKTVWKDFQKVLYAGRGSEVHGEGGRSDGGRTKQDDGRAR